MMGPTLSRRLVAEFLGTAVLLATVVGSGIMAQRLAGGNDAIALLGNTLPTGAILAVLITMLGPISGAHFNPAVSLTFLVRRELTAGEAGTYVLAAGGRRAYRDARCPWHARAVAASALSVKARSGAAQGFAEWVATFGLVATIMLTLRSKPQAVAMSVGSTSPPLIGLRLLPRLPIPPSRWRARFLTHSRHQA